MTGMYRHAPRFVLACTLVLLGALSACSDGGDALQRIQSRGELKVVTRNSPTTYYLDRDGANGFEYALASLLARDLGVELKISTAFTLDGVFEMLTRGDADLAAAGLALTQQRASLFPHSAAYDKTRSQVVYVVGSQRPGGAADMAGRKIVVLADAGNAEELRNLQQQAFPDLRWQEVEGADAMELLGMLDAGEAELAVVNSNEFESQRGLYPRLNVAFDLVPDRELDMVWYLAPGADNARLQAYIDQFFQRLQEDGTLERLRQQYFRHSEGFSRKSSHAFNLNVQTALPQYKELIKQVAREYQLEWQLLAAIAYQESHWDPLATSPTGVRGLMMLTQPTADEIGVSDRLDPLQSLRGGSRYLKDIKRRLPKSIREPDRTWFALAAYNLGLGHLEDARVLTERQGGNPNSWDEVIKRLPLLQKRKHFKDTRYGYAAGAEAAKYVQNIRHYQNILNWQDISDNKPLPPLKVEEFLPEILRGVELHAL
jgi:membrane-bound lytic murein transglycosylase F